MLHYKLLVELKLFFIKNQTELNQKDKYFYNVKFNYFDYIGIYLQIAVIVLLVTEIEVLLTIDIEIYYKHWNKYSSND